MARPPKISDAVLRQVIEELRQSEGTLTGTAVRAELHRRFGLRAGTQRVYRLLQEAPSPAPNARAPLATDEASRRIAALEIALAEALKRAELAEHRERVHQDRWATEIHELREEVRRLRGR